LFSIESRSISGTSRGAIESAIRLQSRSSSPSGSTTPVIVRVESSTPIIIRPPAVLTKATMVLRIFLGDERSLLNSRVFPSGWLTKSDREKMIRLLLLLEIYYRTGL